MALSIELQDTVFLRLATPPPEDRVHVGDLGVNRIRADIPIATRVAPVVEHHAGFDGQVTLRVAL